MSFQVWPVSDQGLRNEVKPLLRGNVKTFHLGHCLRAKAPDGDGKSDCPLTHGKSKGEINIVVGRFPAPGLGFWHPEKLMSRFGDRLITFPCQLRYSFPLSTTSKQVLGTVSKWPFISGEPKQVGKQ